MSADTPPRGGTRLVGRLLIVAVLAMAIAAVFLLRNGRTGPEPPSGIVPAAEEQHEPIVPDIVEPAAGPKVEPAAATSPGTAPGPTVAPAAAPPAVPAVAAVPLPRLIDLGADKCVPCKMMAPILADLRLDYAGRFEVVFIDVWKERAKATEYGIQVIPTQIFYDPQGKELFRHQGFFSREEILGTWREHGFDFGEL